MLSPAATAPCRFAFVVPNYYPETCGVGDHSMRLAAALIRQGHEAAIFTHAPAQPNPAEPGLAAVGVNAHGPVLLAHALARRIAAGGFSHVVIQYTPQMWGIWRFGSPALALLAALLRRRGLRVVLVLHEPYTPWSKRPDLIAGALLLRTQLALLLRFCDPIFVTTESRKKVVEHTMLGVLPCPTPLVLRVGPGALPTASTRAQGGHRIGLFSTLAVGKRFDIVLEAFELIARVHADAELLLIGDFGNPESAAHRQLSRQIASSPVGARVRVTGRLPLDEISAVISTLDLYLFTINTGANTRSSTLPVALGAGVPVVAISGLETDPLFVDGENLVFAEDLTGPAFARAALRIFAEPALAARLAEGGRELYRDHLSWDRIVGVFLAALGGPLPSST